MVSGTLTGNLTFQSTLTKRLSNPIVPERKISGAILSIGSVSSLIFKFYHVKITALYVHILQLPLTLISSVKMSEPVPVAAIQAHVLQIRWYVVLWILDNPFSPPHIAIYFNRHRFCENGKELHAN